MIVPGLRINLCTQASRLVGWVEGSGARRVFATGFLVMGPEDAMRVLPSYARRQGCTISIKEVVKHIPLRDMYHSEKILHVHQSSQLRRRVQLGPHVIWIDPDVFLKRASLPSGHEFNERWLSSAAAHSLGLSMHTHFGAPVLH